MVAKKVCLSELDAAVLTAKTNLNEVHESFNRIIGIRHENCPGILLWEFDMSTIAPRRPQSSFKMQKTRLHPNI